MTTIRKIVIEPTPECRREEDSEKANAWPDTPALQASHSPLPWRLAGGMVDGYAIISEHHAVVSQKLPSYNARFIVRACNEYEALKEELAVAKSQIENHDATLAQVRLNEKHNAQRLADALRSTMARLEYAHSKVAFDTKHHEALNKASEALAQWEGSK